VVEIASFGPRSISPTIILEGDVNAPVYSQFLALRVKQPGNHAVAALTIGTGAGLGFFSDGRTAFCTRSSRARALSRPAIASRV
jgi:hypothetical protein